MGDQDDGPPLEARPAGLADLVSLCDQLNREGAHYVVIGGFAIIQAGFVRATQDIDLLIEASAANQQRVRTALMTLPDQAVRDMRERDLDDYVVVRVVDEIVVDLLKSACGIDYAEASRMVDVVTLEGVPIRFPSPTPGCSGAPSRPCGPRTNPTVHSSGRCSRRRRATPERHRGPWLRSPGSATSDLLLPRIVARRDDSRRQARSLGGHSWLSTLDAPGDAHATPAGRWLTLRRCPSLSVRDLLLRTSADAQAATLDHVADCSRSRRLVRQ